MEPKQALAHISEDGQRTQTVAEHLDGTARRSASLGPQNTWVTGKESLRTADAGGDTPHNNTPPYYAVYWWHRTA